MVRSINQFPVVETGAVTPSDGDNAHYAYGAALPNFRNLGIVLRILVAVNTVALIGVVLQMPSWQQFGGELLETAAMVEPLLILVLAVLYGANGVLARLRFVSGAATVITIAVLLTAALNFAAADFVPLAWPALARYGVVVGLTALMVLSYFELRGRALSPAFTEARLQALQARIRPHFLFNSLTAVLSLIRSEPRRAEAALEDMAELFRVLMADNRRLIPLKRELDLCRQYLAVESLRLGERLQMEWHIGEAPLDALVPPLVLQPLLENAVYHGIEPLTVPGTVTLAITVVRDTVQMVLSNPYDTAPGRNGGNHGGSRNGNRMAVDNIRERLQLHFDAEASLATRVADGTYEVRIVMPYRREGA